MPACVNGKQRFNEVIHECRWNVGTWLVTNVDAVYAGEISGEVWRSQKSDVLPTRFRGGACFAQCLGQSFSKQFSAGDIAAAKA